MYFIGLGSALPPNRFLQTECWTALQSAPQFPQLPASAQGLLRRVLNGPNGITSRYLAVNDLKDTFELCPDVLHQRFAKWAPLLAVQAAERALISANKTASSIDGILISTCTGYLCPGLTSYVSEQLGLNNQAIALDLVGQGCGAALPNLTTADSLIAAGRCQNVLSICVEICSAAFYLDADPGVLISACLFGDAAGAAVLSDSPNPTGRRIKWMRDATCLDPAARDLLRFESRNGLLRNILSKEVPALAAHHAGEIVSRLTKEAQLKHSDISNWILHAGGRQVLAALRKKLKLTEEDVRSSSTVLNDRGNISSPFVLHALEESLKQDPPDGQWLMSSFGAGFTCHGALLEVTSNEEASPTRVA